MGIVIAIIGFGLIIAIHEFGHFIAAKWAGVKVNEFSIGMGFPIFKKQFKETLFSIRMLPIGGYCAMEGESESSDDKNALNNKPIYKRMIIMAAGAFMNLVLGLILVIILFSMFDVFPTTTITNFAENAESHNTGLESGDRIIEVNGHHVFTFQEMNYFLATDSNGIYDFTVIRNGEKQELKNVKLSTKIDSETKKETQYRDFNIKLDDCSVTNVLKYSCKYSLTLGRMVWLSLGDLVSGKYQVKDISGPIGIVSIIDDAAQKQENETTRDVVMNVLSIFSFISINIGLFNLLPIPGLDGSHIVFLIIEAIIGRPINAKIKNGILTAGLALLLILMIFVSSNDIIKIFRG